MVQIKIPAFSFEVLKKAPTPGSALSSAPNISLVNPELYDGKVCVPAQPSFRCPFWGHLMYSLPTVLLKLCHFRDFIYVHVWVGLHFKLFCWDSDRDCLLGVPSSVVMAMSGICRPIWRALGSGSLAARISEHLFWILFWRGIVLEQEAETQSVFFLPVHD